MNVNKRIMQKNMIDMVFNSPESNLIITCIVEEMSQCMEIDHNDLSDDEEKCARQINEYINYSIFIHYYSLNQIMQCPKSRNDQQFIIFGEWLFSSFSKRNTLYRLSVEMV